MNIIEMVEKLGKDFDLIAKSDAWLYEEEKFLLDNITSATNELCAIKKAQQIKALLKDQNLVAMTGIEDEIRIMKLPRAIIEVDQADIERHMHQWEVDGYDVVTSMQMKDYYKQEG